MERICSLAPVVPIIVKADCLTDIAKHEFLKVIEDNIKSISLNNYQQWICYDFYPNKDSFAPPTSPSAFCQGTNTEAPQSNAYNTPERTLTPDNRSEFCIVKPSLESCESTESTDDVVFPSHVFNSENYSEHAMATSDIEATTKINFNIARSLLLGDPIETASSSENGSPDMCNPGILGSERCNKSPGIEFQNVFILVSGYQSAGNGFVLIPLSAYWVVLSYYERTFRQPLF